MKKDEGRPIIVKFVRRLTKSELMANQKSLNDCEEKIFINDDITLLRMPLAKALRLRANIKVHVVMLNEKVVNYETDESINYFCEINRKQLQRKGEENCKTVTCDNVEHEWSLHLKCEIKQPPL